MSPIDRTLSPQRDGAGGRPLVHTPHSFTTNRYHAMTTVEEGEKVGEDIEMGERGTRSGGGGYGIDTGDRETRNGVGGYGGHYGDVGVAIGTASDEVSQYGGSVGTAETDTVKHLEETRPVDGF